MSNFFQKYKWVLVIIFGIIVIGIAYIAGTGSWPSLTASSTSQISSTSSTQTTSSSTSTKAGKKNKGSKKATPN